MDVASGIIRTDTDARSNTLWGMGTQKVYDESDRIIREGPSYRNKYDSLCHAKYELAGGVALLMEQHSEAADELRSVALQFIEAVQRAGPPRPHPVVWGTVVAVIALSVTMLGSMWTFASSQGELKQRVVQVEKEVARIPDVERRQTDSEKALSRIEQKIDDLRKELERR